MQRVDQTINGDGEEGRPVGNCWQACIASLLDMPIDQVPHFARDEPEWWFYKTCLFVLRQTGYNLGCFNPDFPITEPGGYVIATGRSPRGDYSHSVILDGVTGELAHDPHESRAGLEGPPVDVFCFVDV